MEYGDVLLYSDSGTELGKDLPIIFEDLNDRDIAFYYNFPMH